MNRLFKTYVGAAFVGASLMPRSYGRAADSPAAAQKADQNVIERTNDDVRDAAQDLKQQGEDQRKAGQKIENKGRKDAEALRYDTRSVSELNDSVARKRSQANDYEAKGRLDLAQKLRSEANDEENRSRSLQNDLVGKDQAAQERQQRGQELQQRGSQAAQEGEAAYEQAR